MNNKFALIPAGIVLASAAAFGASAPAIAAPTTSAVTQPTTTSAAPTARSFNWEKYVGHDHHKRHHAKRHHHVKRHHHENKWEKRGREIGRYYEMKYGR